MKELLRTAFTVGQQWVHDMYNDKEVVSFKEWYNSDEVQEQVKILNKPVVRLSFSDEKFRELFNEPINAGRDMQIRDNLGNSYMSEEMYFKDVKARYSNEA